MHNKTLFFSLLLILCCTLLASTDKQVFAQTYQEVLIQLRYEDGRPVPNVTVKILHVYNQTSMGERTTNSNGIANWSLPIGYEYEVLLPDEYPLSEAMQAELGDAGYTNLGFRLGKLGDAPRDPITIGYVVTNEGNPYIDRSPEEPVPSFDVPDENDDHNHNIETTPTAVMSEPTAAPTAAPIKAESSRPTWQWILGWVLFGIILVALVAGWLWLRPVLLGRE